MTVNVLARDSSTGRLKEVAVNEVPPYQVVKNYIQNSNFDINQRYGASGSANGVNSVYTNILDRWGINFNGTGPVVNVSQQAFTAGQTAVPYEPTYFMRVNQTTAGTSSTFVSWTQRIEDVRTLAGQWSTLSFWAKADASRSIQIIFRQSFGSGGSANVDSTPVTISLTTTWQLFSLSYFFPSVSGKTIGAGSYIYAGWQLVTMNTLQIIDIASVQFEAGQSVSTYTKKPLAEELRDCQRYYEKSFNAGIAVAQNTASLVGASISAVPLAGATTYFIATRTFAVPKRTTPTITYYNPSAANAFARNTTRNTDATTTTTTGAGENSFGIQITGLAAWTVGDTVCVHYSADAEL